MVIAIFAMIGRIILLGFERILFKKAGKDQNSLVSTFWLFGLAAVFQIPLLFIYPFTFQDFLNAAPSAAIYTITFSIYVYVLSNYEVSLVTPFYNFNVFFLLLLSVIFLDETFTIFKIVGIFLLFFGTLFLNQEESILKSFKSVYKNRGCQLMIVVSLLMAIGRVLDRNKIEETSPPIYSFALYFLTGLYIGVILLVQRKGKLIIESFKSQPKEFLAGGAANAYSYLFLLIAFTEMEVSVAEPLSMLSVILSIILSYFFFREKIKNRLVGALIMFSGAILLVLGV